MGVSLSSLVNKQEDKVEDNEEIAVNNGNNKFTEKDLITAWDEFSDNLKKERLLKNAMMMYKPKMVSDVVFEVEVNSDLNKEYLNSNGDMILSFLREKVKNDDLSMTITISKDNVIKKPLTSREIFDDMAETNSALQKLSDEFGLELS